MEYALDDFSIFGRIYIGRGDINEGQKDFHKLGIHIYIESNLNRYTTVREFKEILQKDAGTGDGKTLRDVSTYETEMQINNAVVQQAEDDTKKIRL